MKCKGCWSTKFKENICEYCRTVKGDKEYKWPLKIIKGDMWNYKTLINSKLIWDMNNVDYAENCVIRWDMNNIKKSKNITVIWDMNNY